MEYYEGTCTSCDHMSRWTDLKTTMFLGETELAASQKRQRTCPSCGQETRSVRLDHDSEGAKDLDGAIQGIAKELFGNSKPSKEPMSLEDSMAQDFKVGDPVAWKSHLGRITGMLGEPYKGISPRLEVCTPHGSRFEFGRRWVHPINTPEEKAKLEEFEKIAKEHPDAKWYGGKLSG